jgi:hypothetical protein
MDLHKPKPWRGLREFLKEYVIIVVGVLTALAAEQGVEWLRWQEKVERGRTHEAAELNAAYIGAAERNSVEACLDRRLTALRDALLAGEGRWTPLTPAMGSRSVGAVAYAAPSRPWRDESWKSLIADGTVNHFGDDETLEYSRIYAQVAIVRERNETEVALAEGLGLLQLGGMLTRAERNQLVTTLERLRTMNHRMALSSRQLMTSISHVAKPDIAGARTFYETYSNARRSCEAMGYASAAAVDVPAGPSPDSAARAGAPAAPPPIGKR